MDGYMNQDIWWTNEDPEQNPYTDDSYDYGCYNNDQYDESYDDECWGWTDNSDQNQHHESSYFSDNPERSEESSFSNKLDQLLNMIEEISNKEENSSKSIRILEEQLEQIVEQLNQQPPQGNLSDTTLVEEVTFLSSDDFHDNKVHKPTQPEVHVVVEEYVSLNDMATERIFESEEVEIESENSESIFHESVTPKVGEEPPITLRKTDAQPFVEVENQKLRPPLFGPINDPPITDELLVINTIDDTVYEHTANMLCYTTNNSEICLSCNRSKALNRSRNEKRKSWNTKHDATHAHKSKMKVFHDLRARTKKSTRKKNTWLILKTFKYFRGGLKSKRFVPDKNNENMTFDPGGSQIIYDLS